MQRLLFIFEMANNHMGDVEHGIAMIRAFRDVARDFDFEFAFKLQYRDLDTFIHPSARGRADLKYVRRFEETRLSSGDFARLLAEMRACGFLTSCTPYDEASVGLLEVHGVDRIKIASCSLTDWPLLERVVKSDKPVIASTAGASPRDLDNVVTFFLNRSIDLTLTHCVAEYPTPDDHLQLSRIDLLRRRYPEARIGYSTHENPASTEAVMIAVAKGATVFEKHVGLPTARYALNAYSASPEQARAWLEAAGRALAACGSETWPSPSAAEVASLQSLRRGLYAARDLAAGERMSAENTTIAFPAEPGQITANQWSKFAHFVALKAIPAGSPLLAELFDAVDEREQVMAAVERVKELLKAGSIVVPGKSVLEISHHYGMERFAEVGLTMVTIVNREYCKKLIVMLPGQSHPEQYHERKEETFVVVHGEMALWLDGGEQHVKVGDVVTVPRGVRHRFRTERGVVFEEISSTHHGNDSFYTDPAISGNTRRKTFLTHWL